MKKPKALIRLYEFGLRLRLQARVAVVKRRIRRFDELSLLEQGRFIVARRRVKDSHEVHHCSPLATPTNKSLASGEMFLSVLKNVRLDVHYGFAITDSCLLLEETAINRHAIDRHLATGKLLRPTTVRTVDRTVLCLECAPNKSNFFHFWFQSLTKLLWLNEPELTGLGPFYLVHTRQLSAWQVALLTEAVPNDVELLHVDKATLVEAPFYVDLPPYSGTVLDERSRARLRTWSDALIVDDRGGLPRHFYISRRGGKVRRPLNEPEVMEALSARGIPTVILEELSMGEQIALFRGAEVIIAQHGAGLTHLFQSSERLQLLEVFSGTPDNMPEQYRGIAAACGFRYSSVFCGSHHHNDDVALPVDEICAWVDSISAGRPAGDTGA